MCVRLTFRHGIVSLMRPTLVLGSAASSGVGSRTMHWLSWLSTVGASQNRCESKRAVPLVVLTYLFLLLSWCWRCEKKQENQEITRGSDNASESNNNVSKMIKSSFIEKQHKKLHDSKNYNCSNPHANAAFAHVNLSICEHIPRSLIHGHLRGFVSGGIGFHLFVQSVVVVGDPAHLVLLM